MANKVLKGLTVKFGADTSDILDALKDVEKKGASLSKELTDINRLLKMNPKNTQLLAQKQKVLAESVETTKSKLDKLKEAEKQVQAQFKKGKVSEEQVRALQREIVATEGKLNNYERALDETKDQLKQYSTQTEKAADDVEELADASKDAEKSSEGLGSALANAAKFGLQAVGAAVGAVIGGLTAAAEGSREYRIEMGKLDTAFTQSGHSSESAKKAYSALQGILGETDQSVEAANHLAKLTDNEKDLATWTGDIMPGVFATFGASLPIEGLAEAANETAKVGQVTGPLADALTWAGVSEDAFNESLAACTSEQERQALITKTLSDLYGDASDAYKETNAEVIRANEANDQWMQSLSGVGGAIEPIITDVKMMGASLLSELVPGVQSVANAFRGVLNGDAGAADQLGVALSDLIVGLLNKAAELLPTLVSVAMSLITTLTTTLISMLPQLVETGIQLIENILLGLTEAIPKIVDALVGMIPNLVAALVSGIPKLIDGAVKLFLALLKAIPILIDALVPQIPTIVMSIVDGLLSNVTALLDGAITLLLAICDAVPVLIKTVVPLMPTIVKKVVQELVRNIPVLLAGAIELFMALIKALPTVIVEMQKNIPSIIVAIVEGLLAGVSDIAAVGGDLIRGLWDGIKDMTGWITEKLKGFGDTVLDGIKDFFGIESPSRVMAKEVGRFLPSGVAKGVDDNADVAVDAMTSMSDDMLNEAEQMNGIAFERRLHHTFDPVSPAETVASGLMNKLDSILDAIEQGKFITLDGDALVGATASRMDRKLGQFRVLAARGAK